MTRDDRFYAFVVARTSRSRAHIRRICVHKRWIKAAVIFMVVVATGLIYGFYGLTQQAAHIRTERENARLRAQNEKQQKELQNLNNRVNAVEDTSRRLAEMSGLPAGEQQTPRGQGGPANPIDSAAALASIQSKTDETRAPDVGLSGNGARARHDSFNLASDGTLESGVGGRRNPFSGRGYEYHEGQDIDAAYGDSGPGCCQWQGDHRRTTERLWQCCLRGSRRRLVHPLRTPFSNQCCDRPDRHTRSNNRPRRFDRKVNRPAPSLRSAHQQSAGEPEKLSSRSRTKVDLFTIQAGPTRFPWLCLSSSFNTFNSKQFRLVPRRLIANIAKPLTVNNTRRK